MPKKTLISVFIVAVLLNYVWELAQAPLAEIVAVHILGRWQYTDHMPTVPGLGIGLVPIEQMLILPPLIFCISAKMDSNPRSRLEKFNVDHR